MTRASANHTGRPRRRALAKLIARLFPPGPPRRSRPAREVAAGFKEDRPAPSASEVAARYRMTGGRGM